MAKMNCWEFKKCGRQPGGANVTSLGVCPAAIEKKVNDTNSGINGGRCCWAVSGTLCGNIVQGTFASKIKNCINCEFYLQVRDEEGKSFCTASEILAKLK